MWEATLSARGNYFFLWGKLEWVKDWVKTILHFCLEWNEILIDEWESVSFKERNGVCACVFVSEKVCVWGRDGVERLFLFLFWSKKPLLSEVANRSQVFLSSGHSQCILNPILMSWKWVISDLDAFNLSYFMFFQFHCTCLHGIWI